MSLMLYIDVVLQDLLLSGVLWVHSWRAAAHSAAGSASKRRRWAFALAGVGGTLESKRALR